MTYMSNNDIDGKQVIKKAQGTGIETDRVLYCAKFLQAGGASEYWFRKHGEFYD